MRSCVGQLTCGRGDGVTAGIVGGTIRGSDWCVGKDCGGWPHMVGMWDAGWG